MTNSALDPDTIRSFNPVPPTMYDDVASTRARARLEQIVATPPERVPVPVDTPRRRASVRTRAVRWAAIPVAAAAGLVLSIALPGGTPSAFASWTAVADPLVGDELTAATSACTDLFGSVGVPTELAVTGAERRGDWSLMVFSGPDGAALVCLTTDQGESATVSTLNAPNMPEGQSSGWTAGSGNSQVAGFSSGGPSDASDAPDGIGYEVGMSGTVNGDGFTAISGEVAPGVTAVTLHAGRLTVDATLGDGRYLAWWPGVVDLYDDVTYTITFADGTVVEDAPPTGR